MGHTFRDTAGVRYGPYLQKFFNFCAAHLPVRLDIETKFTHF